MGNNESTLKPRSKEAIEEVVRGLGFKNYTLSTQGLIRGENFLGQIHKISVEERDKNSSQVSLVIKQSPSSQSHRNIINNIFQREINVYNEVLPTLYRVQEYHNIPEEHRFHFAKFYKGVAEDQNEILVMEDLTPQGYAMHDRFKPLKYEKLSLCFKNLAYFHATSLCLKSEKPEIYERLTRNALNFSNNNIKINTFLPRNVEIIKTVCCGKPYVSKVIDHLNDFISNYLNIHDGIETAPYNVICHGDCWSNNFLFKYEDDELKSMVMIDWQMIRQTTPVIDILQLIATSTDKEIRKLYIQEMLDLYYATLAMSLSRMGLDISDHYPENVYRSHLKKYIAWVLISSAGHLPFTLNNEKEEPKRETLMKDYQNYLNVVTFSDYCKERIRDVVEFSLDYM